MAEIALSAPGLIIGAAVFVELFVRLRVFRRIEMLREASARAGALVRAQKISDHWKERMIPVYAGRVFRSSLWVSGLILAAGAVFLAVLQAFGAAFAGAGFNAFEAAMAPAGIALATAAGTGWAFLRSRLVHA